MTEGGVSRMLREHAAANKTDYRDILTVNTTEPGDSHA